MTREACSFHSDEDPQGVFVSDEVGYSFTCEREGHPEPGPRTWFRPPEPPPGLELGGLADELGLAVELPRALSEYRGKWVEYGVLEHAYAQQNPTDWRRLVDLYGHRAIKGSQYTVSAFLGATLGRLWRNGDVSFHEGPATGRWKYNGRISWWALPPEPDWSERLSWDDSGLTVDYVPGQQEAS